MVDMEGLRRRLAQLEDDVEKAYLTNKNGLEKHAHPTVVSVMLNQQRTLLIRIRELRAVVFGDVGKDEFKGSIWDPKTMCPRCKIRPTPYLADGLPQLCKVCQSETFPGSITSDMIAGTVDPSSPSRVGQRFSHYHKPCPYPSIDVYRVLQLFGVTDPGVQHAIKKLLVLGARGHKDASKDVSEAIASLNRWQEMREEEANAQSHDPNRIVTGSIEPDCKL